MSIHKSVFSEFKRDILSAFNDAPPFFKAFFKLLISMVVVGFTIGVLFYSSVMILALAAAWHFITVS